VRGLDRELAKISRKVIKSILTKKKDGAHVTVNSKNIDKYLGVRKYTYGIAEKENQIGQVTGLAWTEVGGELLTIEAVKLPGKGNTVTTGKLGDVMNESIKAAISVVRAARKRSGSPRTSGRRSTCTCTCPRAPRPRTARARASHRHRDHLGASPASRCAATSR
jgi:ATP-dependent Lon protease